MAGVQEIGTFTKSSTSDSQLEDSRNVNKRAPLGEKNILQTTNTPMRFEHRGSIDWKFTVVKSHNSLPKCSKTNVITMEEVKSRPTIVEQVSDSMQSGTASHIHLQDQRPKKRKWKWKMDTVPMPKAKRSKPSQTPMNSKAARPIAIPRMRIPV